MSIRNSAPPPPVVSGSRRSRRPHQPNAIHELYFHDVFNLLRVYPEGLSIAVVTTSIPRWKYPGGVPQVKKLAEIEPKTFRLQGEILFVKVTSPRVNSIATTPSTTNK